MNERIALVKSPVIVLSSLALIIPLLFPSPQMITGTLVNALLFLAAKRLTKKELALMVMLPSLGAISRGWLFGPQTLYLVYFLPFIWLANYLMVINAKRGFLTAATIKYLLLATASQIYLRLQIVPAAFGVSMGYIQLITALGGGLLAYLYERQQNIN